MPLAPASAGRPGGADRDAQRLPGLDRDGQHEQQRAGLLGRDRPQAGVPAGLGEADEQDAEGQAGDQRRRTGRRRACRAHRAAGRDEHDGGQRDQRRRPRPAGRAARPCATPASDRDHRRAHRGHRPDHAHLPAGQPAVQHAGCRPRRPGRWPVPRRRPGRSARGRRTTHQHGPGKHGGDETADDADPQRPETPRSHSPAEIGAAVQQGRGQAEQDSHGAPASSDAGGLQVDPDRNRSC